MCSGLFGFIENYPVQEIAGKGNELDTALNLLRRCSENVLHNGGTKDVEFIPKTSLNILNYDYKRGRTMVYIVDYRLLYLQNAVWLLV